MSSEVSGVLFAVLVLIFESSRSYLTPLVDSGSGHGEICQTRNSFGFPYAVNSQLRTGADNGNPTV